jgi:thiamine pyrophosphate-dependent acetolactate synthase large subunit-like protein
LEQPQTTVADAILIELEKWGITLVFGIPGTSSLGLVEALRRNEKLRYIVVRHEENAAMAASAYHKLTGRIAACLTIAGPGASNLATGLYDAKEDRASVLSINGQVSGQYNGDGSFQEIDQDAFFRPITVYNNTIYDKTQTLKILTQALRYAIVQRGVAQISVPNDIQKELLDTAVCEKEACLTNFDILPNEKDIRKAVALIDAAKKPVIIAGWGAFESGEVLLRFAGKIKAPIVTTYRAKGILPEENPWVLGILGNVGSPATRNIVSESDLIITLGVGFSKQTHVPMNKPLIQVELDPLKIGKIPFTVSLWGNCTLILPLLVEAVREKQDDAVVRELAEIKKKWSEQLLKEADAKSVPIRPPFLMKVLSDFLPNDAVIALDIGESAWWFGRNFRMSHQRFVMSGYLGTMGFGLPGALAAKLAYPKKTVVCITGDGGFSMVMADLVTAVKYELPMIVVVLNNRQLAMIQVEQKAEGYPNFGTDLLNPDFAVYAQACGCVGMKVVRPEEFPKALEQALKKNTVVVIDVETDPKRF